ncbi:hypothetical protein AGMMS49546_01720 [Spirochaetia bacterium]|nr:hypothetical protein AGMMS49546_01720 [Spirochaetia bacterium]
MAEKLTANEIKKTNRSMEWGRFCRRNMRPKTVKLSYSGEMALLGGISYNSGPEKQRGS